jgi:hypothetical protein
VTDRDDPPPSDDDVLRRRLEETASGELSSDRLRRRYDDLRRDYVSLMQRLSDLEERSVAVAPSRPSFGVLESMLAPLVALRDEYLEAVTGLHDVVAAIDGATNRMKTQRSAPAARAEATTEPSTAEKEVQVDVRGRSAGELLAFREQILGLAGVRAVHIHAIDPERTTLIVELGTHSSTGS